jgi:beta-lactamase class D
LARQVGVDTYRDYLRRAGYGQLREPFDVGSFWRDGALTISAEQQVAFLSVAVPLIGLRLHTLYRMMNRTINPESRSPT